MKILILDSITLGDDISLDKLKQCRRSKTADYRA